MDASQSHDPFKPDTSQRDAQEASAQELAPPNQGDGQGPSEGGLAFDDGSEIPAGADPLHPQDETPDDSAAQGSQDSASQPSADAAQGSDGEAAASGSEPENAPTDPGTHTVSLQADSSGAGYLLLGGVTPANVSDVTTSAGTVSVGSEDGSACLWLAGAGADTSVELTYTVAQES